MSIKLSEEETDSAPRPPYPHQASMTPRGKTSNMTNPCQCREVCNSATLANCIIRILILWKYFKNPRCFTNTAQGWVALGIEGVGGGALGTCQVTWSESGVSSLSTPIPSSQSHSKRYLQAPPRCASSRLQVIRMMSAP